MNSLNRVTLIGNLGRDPEVRYTSDGQTICNLSIATTDRWKDKATGERKDRTEWHRCVAFGNAAEIAAKYLTKGAKVYLDGALRTRKWQDQSGADKYSTEIVFDHLILLGAKNEQDSTEQQDINDNQDRPSQRAPRAPTQRAPAPEFDDDIPF
jgi:single-strand DNA-binding protein